MKVKVNYLGLVKTYTNRIQDEKELPEGTSLAVLLDKLSSEFGKPFNPEIYDPNKKEVKPMFVVMVNGVLMDQPGIENKLKNGDNIVIMPLMTGG
jgi:MoaD family protein